MVKKMQFREMMANHRAIITGGVSEILEAKKSMKIKMRLHITYEKASSRI
ncbi:MAG: hypothetical protein ACKPKO_08495 [Candidatus Fonsibacter sp.]